METITIFKNTDTSVPFQLRDGYGNPLSAILDSDTLSANIWAGDDTGLLASPPVAWDDKTAAKATLSITSADVADLDPGLYQILVLFNRGLVSKPAFRAFLSVKASPGTSSTLRTYGKYSDLLTLMPTIENYQLEQTETAFMEERATASRWLDGIILAKFRCPEYVQGLLDADKLVVSPDVSQIVALYALSLALKSRVGTKGLSDAIPGLGKQFRSQAEDMARTITVRITGLAPINLSSITVLRG